MQCSEIMNTDVITLAPDATVIAATKLMREHNVGLLPICNKDGRVLGVLTDRDIATRVIAADRDAASCRVSEVMTTEILSCEPNDDVGLVTELMAQARKTRVLVVDEHAQLVGIVSLVDVAATNGPGRAGETLKRVAPRERHQSTTR
jgi:CBS domain-containing protein